MMEIYLYHSLSCLWWTPWHQEKVPNWDFPLCFLVNSLFYNYNQFSSLLMVNSHLCLDFFVSSSIKILYPLFGQLRLFKIFRNRSKVFQKQIIYFLLFCLMEVLFVCHMHIFMNMQWFDGVFYGRKCIIFYHDIICLQLINQINYQYHIVWNQS